MLTQGDTQMSNKIIQINGLFYIVIGRAGKTCRAWCSVEREFDRLAW